MAVKNLYKGVWNYPAKIEKEYASAFSLNQAKKIMVDRISGKQHVHPSTVWNWMKQHPPLWDVKLEIEWEEVAK
jgi:hypothetical protein